jgi:osmotically-inducible protein OsmY
MRNLFIILTMALALQACFFVAGAAAGAAGVAVVYDHRKLEKIVQDQKIVSAAAQKINAIPELTEDSHISITCFNQILLLTGETTTPALREQAEDAVRSVPNVKRIYNEITIKGPTSSLTRASDSWITAKIKTQMLATKGLQSSTIKVVTENGTVYLLGIVTHKQAEMGVEIARQISGVQKVVRIFQYTD